MRATARPGIEEKSSYGMACNAPVRSVPQDRSALRLHLVRITLDLGLAHQFLHIGRELVLSAAAQQDVVRSLLGLGVGGCGVTVLHVVDRDHGEVAGG